MEKIRLEKLLKKFEVNDIHIHLGRTNGANNFLDPNHLFDFIEQFQINEVALMPFEVDTDKINQKIIELSKEHKKIHGFFWIQKHRIKEDVDILKKELGEGLIGVKFHGSYENLPVSSEIYDPIMQLLHDKNSLLLVHCGRYKDGYPESATSFLHGLKIAEKYPKIKVILAHMGGNDTTIVKRAVNSAVEFDNVYFDTSGISTPFRVEYATKFLGPKRILFGSDYPWCSFRGIYYGVEDSLIDDKSKDMIFHENFTKILES